MPICLGVSTETEQGDRRVALVPSVAERFKKLGVEVLLESGAGAGSYYPDKTRNVICVERGEGKGFSGIDNALFFLDNTRMLYGDGQEVAGKLIAELKQL